MGHRIGSGGRASAGPRQQIRTVLSCQAPPRAVRTPRSFDALATERNVVAPAACIWRTIGSTLAAKASAASRLAATPLACASGRLVRFPRTSRDRRQSFATWAHLALMAAPQFQVTARRRSTPAGRIGSLALLWQILTPLLDTDPFSTVRASFRWQMSDERDDGVATDGKLG